MITQDECLLLNCRLGSAPRNTLTMVQLRMLIEGLSQRSETAAQLTDADFMEMGFNLLEVAQIRSALDDVLLLMKYRKEAAARGCFPLTVVDPEYPKFLDNLLGVHAPSYFWYRGDLQILKMPMVALVGSRDLGEENYQFAAEVGKQAALQGYALVSGNARGADQAAQAACLAHGGYVVSVLADSLRSHKPQSRVLYLSEDGYDMHFTAYRALHRNHVIHALGEKVFVAQCNYRKGGTWDGTKFNLERSIRPVFCFRDGSPAAADLEELGAVQVELNALVNIRNL